MAVAVECAFLDALSFNAIQTFEEQEKEVDKATLMAIADIFVRHSMHKKLGAGLLHRHDTLQDGTVMFHEVQSPESDICIPKALSSIDMDKIAANSWFLNQNGLFQAYEYDASGEATQIDAAFASDLANFLKAHSSFVAIPAILSATWICSAFERSQQFKIAGSMASSAGRSSNLDVACGICSLRMQLSNSSRLSLIGCNRAWGSGGGRGAQEMLTLSVQKNIS